MKMFTDIGKATSERNEPANPKEGPSDPEWLCQPGLGDRNTTLWMGPGNSVGQAPPRHHQQRGTPIKKPPRPRTAAGKEGGQVPAGPDPAHTFQSPLTVAGQAQICAAKKGREPYLGGQKPWASVPAQPPPPPVLTSSKSFTLWLQDSEGVNKLCYGACFLLEHLSLKKPLSESWSARHQLNCPQASNRTSNIIDRDKSPDRGRCLLPCPTPFEG